MNHLLISTMLGEYSVQALERIAQAPRDSGCNIEVYRMLRLGESFALLAEFSGTWDAIAKMEDLSARLAEEFDLAVSSRRNQEEEKLGEVMPYAIDLVAASRSGIVYEILRFLRQNEVEVQEQHTNSYQAPHSNARMLSLHMNVDIPVRSSLAALRAGFMDLCEQLNLDGIIEPVK